MTWHVRPESMARYAAGLADPAGASSVEAHLLACDVCRATLVAMVDRARLDRVWAGVVDAVDAPARSWVERLLGRFGVADDTARLLAATPSLQTSWLLAVGVALAFAVTAAQSGRAGVFAFLLLAPLLPLAGVAVAYGRGVDPTYEIAMAAPVSQFRLLLLRAVTVMVATCALIGVASLALPGPDWTAAAWLLPAVGLSSGTLALSSVVRAPVAAVGLATAWMATVTYGERVATRDLAAFGPACQATSLAVAAVAVVALTVSRDRFEEGVA